MDILGKICGAFDEWVMTVGKVKVLLVIIGLIWTEVQKPSLSISRKVKGGDGPGKLRCSEKRRES